MTRHTSSRTQRQGFSLIEILVVLAIVAIVSSITLGGYKEMTSGNKRVSCQTNLVQIYQAARLYAGDEGGKFPYFKQNASAGTCTTTEGIGLWSLYTFPKTTDFNTIAPVGSAPVERYLRSTKVLHCPSDYQNDKLYSDLVTKTDYNPDYLSYQKCDGDIGTYATTRATSTADTKWKRQLLHFDGSTFVNRQPTADTVVTWCQFHRGERKMDNVLFYDGTVQLLPRQQTNPSDVVAPSIATDPILTDWKRKPKAPQ